MLYSRPAQVVDAARSQSERGPENFPIGKFFRDRLTRPSAAFRDMTLYETIGRNSLRFNLK